MNNDEVWEMQKFLINEKISYIESIDFPLSADIGIVRDGSSTWLYDVGNGENVISELNGRYNVVLSHFHPDHIANINRINIKNLYVSKETFKYISKEKIEVDNITIVTEPINIGNIHIFPLPSSHAKGCLGLEIDEYVFVGDALYSKSKNNSNFYNAQLLKQEIDVLSNLSATFLLASHFKGLARNRGEVLNELREIYSMRKVNSSEIYIE